jgi:hypothetical protein
VILSLLFQNEGQKLPPEDKRKIKKTPDAKILICYFKRRFKRRIYYLTK